MTRRPLVNIAQSVHQRLLTQAKATGRPFNEPLQHMPALKQAGLRPTRIVAIHNLEQSQNWNQTVVPLKPQTHN